MAEHCQVPNAIEKIFSASHCGVAYMGGSVTAGVGASNTAETSFRALFVQYLYRQYHPRYHCQPSEIMAAIGANESFSAVFTMPRNVTPHNPDLAFIEFCVNDSWTPDKELVLKGMEGIVRQLLTLKERCSVILLGAGRRPGTSAAGPAKVVDHALHRRVAEHYDLPFVDAQEHIFRTLKERGQSWDDLKPPYLEKDDVHLNDYGQQLVFEAMRDCFEEQVRLYQEGRRKDRDAPLPEPLVSDEFQFVEMVDPANKHKGLTLEGSWQKKPEGLVPWYFDNLMVGSPGAKMRLLFQGTAVCLWGLMYNNGLKVNAMLDGKKVSGPYLRHYIEFGKGTVLAHAMPPGEHVLELVVGEPSKRHNKLENPTAQIAFIGIARKPPVT